MPISSASRWTSRFASAVSPNPEVLRCAERIGAHAIEGAFDGKRGPYPITVDASGDAAGLRLAIDSTDLEGVCTSPVYYPAPETGVPLGRMYSRGIRFHAGRCHARGVIPEVAGAIAEGRLHPDAIVTRLVAWREAAQAIAEPAVKLVVEREAA
jgi:threonine dehydrogenase-like Zn-dependent dehydrogenase